jgi:hypothetical protein
MLQILPPNPVDLEVLEKLKEPEDLEDLDAACSRNTPDNRPCKLGLRTATIMDNPEAQRRLETMKEETFRETAAYLAAKHRNAKRSPKQANIPFPEFPKTKLPYLDETEWLIELKKIRADYHLDLINHHTDIKGIEDAASARISIGRLETAAIELINAINGLGRGAIEIINQSIDSSIQLTRVDIDNFPDRKANSEWIERLQVLADQALEAQKQLDHTASTTGSVSYFMRFGRCQPENGMVWMCLNLLNNHGMATESLGVKMVTAILRVEAVNINEFRSIKDNAGRPAVRKFMKDNLDLMFRS